MLPAESLSFVPSRIELDQLRDWYVFVKESSLTSVSSRSGMVNFAIGTYRIWEEGDFCMYVIMIGYLFQTL